MPILQSVTLDQLTIRDERSFRHIALYGTLKQLLLDDRFQFRIAEKGASWQRVLFLNLTFWNAAEPSDVLEDTSIDADVVTHAAWHHAARKALGGAGAPMTSQMTSDALFLGESIASAFDLYLVGRTLGHVKPSGKNSSSFLATQVPAMAAVAADAGLSATGFEALLRTVADDPERAFEELRQLLFDAATTLVTCDGVDAGVEALGRFATHRFAALLHHYEVSNWVLYGRAYGRGTIDPGIRAIDRALREAPVSLDWLEQRWLGA
ncbi:MAG: hypothetical protein Q8P18_08275 [Pseudomonadota bacterium]|nr:hypothetical protein [Pseudomonadota bacterium]